MKKTISAVLLLSIWLSGCSGSGDGLDGSGQPLTEGSVAVPLAANFQAIQDNVFTPVCIVCHAGAAAPLGLKLDTDNSFAFLVGVSSTEEPGLQRVNPGDPDNSYLIQKLEGTAKVGGQMPLGRSALPQATIDLVRQWIAEGAENSSAPVADSTIAPIVKSITPDNGATLTTLPTTIMAVFSQPMDATSVNSGTVSLLGSGGDGTFDDGNEVTLTPLPVALSDINPTAASVDLSGVASAEDSYRITLVGTGGNVIMSGAALTLDGDSDGTPGGDFQATFTVASPPALPTGGAGSGSTPALQTIQSSIFTPICTVCHAGPGAPEGLQLSAGNSLSMLVNVPSAQVPGMMRIKPGDPNNSYLIKKLEGTASVGGQMPRGGPFLPQATIDFIRQWITDGASATTIASGAGNGGAALPPPPSPPPVTVAAPAPAPIPLAPSGGSGTSAFQTIQSTVFTPICTLCHKGPGAPEGLQLDASNSLSNLVSVPSAQVPGMMRVKPGAPNNSYIIKKLEGTASVGGQMPRGGPFLPQATIDFIRQWITDGASATATSSGAENGGAAPPPPPVVVPLQASWRSIQDKIFTPICTACHIGDDAPRKLRLDEANSYALLVNQESKEDGDFQRVAPGNANASYLIKVLEGTTDRTPRMPFGGPYLPQETIDKIRQWIDNGALQ